MSKSLLNKIKSPLCNSVITRNLYNQCSFDARFWNGDDKKEFSDPGYEKYRIAIIRMISGNSPLRDSPATALFDGIPINVFKQGVGILALEKIANKRMYLNNASTDYKKHDDTQPLVTIPTAFYLYSKFNSNIVPHNELRITQPDFIPCVTTLDAIPEAKKLTERYSLIPSLKADPCFYDVKEGKFYYIENGKKSDQILLPKDVLTIENMDHNQEMKQFVEEQYRNEISNYVNWLIKNNGSTIPDNFLRYERENENTKSVLKTFADDVTSLLQQRSQKPESNPQNPSINMMLNNKTENHL